jgi:hypothetical protein
LALEDGRVHITLFGITALDHTKSLNSSFALRFAKFVYDAWTNPRTLRIISDIAGIDLIPNMDYEIGHINISVQNSSDPSEASAPVVNWHKDSYPFVCVLMLSDASEMKGGETALQTGTGEIMKVRGPQMVSCPSTVVVCEYDE